MRLAQQAQHIGCIERECVDCGAQVYAPPTTKQPRCPVCRKATYDAHNANPVGRKKCHQAIGPSGCGCCAWYQHCVSDILMLRPSLPPCFAKSAWHAEFLSYYAPTGWVGVAVNKVVKDKALTRERDRLRYPMVAT